MALKERVYQGLLFWFMTFVDKNHNNADAMKSQVEFQNVITRYRKATKKKKLKLYFLRSSFNRL